MAQAILPIVKHFSVARSVAYCLSHLCTLFKPFDEFKRHLAGTLVRSNDGEMKFGVEHYSSNIQYCKLTLPPGEQRKTDCAWYQIILVTCFFCFTRNHETKTRDTLAELKYIAVSGLKQ